MRHPIGGRRSSAVSQSHLRRCQKKNDEYVHDECQKIRANARLTVTEVLQAIAFKQKLAGDDKPQYAKEAPQPRYVDLWQAFLTHKAKLYLKHIAGPANGTSTMGGLRKR